MCLSTSLALDLHLGRVTEDQSLRCSQSGVEIPQNDETSTEEKIVTGESVLEVLASIALWWVVPLMVALPGLVSRNRAFDPY